VQLRLEAQLVAAAGDRLVVRQLAPPDTVGGGVVVDPRPRKHGARAEVVARLRALERGEPAPAPAPAPTPPPPAATPLSPAALRLEALLKAGAEAPSAHGDLAAAAGLQPAEAERALRELERSGRAVRVARNLHYDPAALAALTGRVTEICERDGRATIASVRDGLGTSRRYAQALLEHLDAKKVTRRVGDAHLLR
jgi:selenocysteine-specific elongation factor